MAAQIAASELAHFFEENEKQEALLKHAAERECDWLGGTSNASQQRLRKNES
jgi:hypothetical protein